MASGFITRRLTPTPPPSSSEHPRCPRCNSQKTKFCYYNNYNLAQPRYFCKSCRRYWTLGGTIRNIPVGGTSRRNYLTASASSTSSYSSSGISKRRKSDRPTSNNSSSTASSSSKMVLVDVHHHGVVHTSPQPISVVAPGNEEHFVPRTFGGLLTEPIPSGFRLGLGIEETGFSQGRTPWSFFGEETFFNHVGVGVSIGRQPPPPPQQQQTQHQMVGGGIGDYGSDLFFDAWPISGGYGGGHFTWPDVTVDTTPAKKIE